MIKLCVTIVYFGFDWIMEPTLTQFFMYHTVYSVMRIPNIQYSIQAKVYAPVVVQFCTKYILLHSYKAPLYINA